MPNYDELTTSLLNASNILEDFDLGDITEVISQQINIEDDFDYTTPKIDHYKVIFIIYRKLMEDPNRSDEEKQEAQERFYALCDVILSLIQKKFDFMISDEWMTQHQKDIPAVTYTFYSFFVTDFLVNFMEFCQNYITSHTKTLYNIFKDLDNKKDSSTIANRKIMSPEMAVIASNIYDVIDWSLGSMTMDQFFDSFDAGYNMITVLKGMYSDAAIDGDIVRQYHKIYKNVISLKSQIGYQLLVKIKSGDIPDIFAKPNIED